MMITRLLLVAAMVTFSATAAVAQNTIFLVRHAERADGGGAMSGGKAADPPLSAAGRARAAKLAAMLKDVKLTAVFASEFQRTQETAAPAAKAQGLTVSTVPASQTAALVQKLKTARGAVLVVGHSDKLPDLIAGLGITTPISIGETDFDNLFIVVTGEHPTLVRLHYQ